MTSMDLDQRNRRTARLVLVVVAGMVALAFASVPLYRIFCAVTGFGGPSMMLSPAPDPSKIVPDRVIRIDLSTRVDPHLNWAFLADQRRLWLAVGQQGLVTFTVTSGDPYPTHGTAVYNVTPPKAGRYLKKTQCFCFNQQSLQGFAQANLPVVMYVDPAIMDDPTMNDVHEITLSYIYYKTDTPALNDAMQRFFEDTQ